MKNKKTIYILLPVVAGIWGLLIYKFFTYAHPGEEVTSVAQYKNTNPPTLKKKDTFGINTAFRDPFLDKEYIPSGEKSSVRKQTLTLPPSESSWPITAYKGMVEGTVNKEKVFVLSINGKTTLLKKGDVFEGLKVLEGNRQSVTLIYNKERKILNFEE